MFDITDAHYMGKRSGNGNMIWNCPHCQEPINYYPPDSVGYCECGYCTEEG